MCQQCNEVVENSDSDKDLLLLALAMLGGLIENYVEEGYCDPIMYKTLSMCEKISKKIGIQELADRFITLKMEAGEAVHKVASEQGVDISEVELD